MSSLDMTNELLMIGRKKGAKRHCFAVRSALCPAKGNVVLGVLVVLNPLNRPLIAVCRVLRLHLGESHHFLANRWQWKGKTFTQIQFIIWTNMYTHTLRCNTLHYIKIALHYITLHTTLALHYTTPHCITLHYITSHHMTLNTIAIWWSI